MKMAYVQADAIASCRQSGEPSEWQGREDSCRGSQKVDVSDADEIGSQGQRTADDSQGREIARRQAGLCDGTKHRRFGCWWKSEPDVGRVADGVAARVDRLRCIGNGQVPAVVRLAWEILTKEGREE